MYDDGGTEEAGTMLSTIFSQIAFAALGTLMGWLTGAWIHRAWLRWHPHRIHFWGAWYTDPRLLLAGGLALFGTWLGLLFAS